MATIPEAFAEALRQHQTGHLQEAEALYRRILTIQSDHPDALHLLGVIAHQMGRHDEAVRYISQAIACNSKAAEFHVNIAEAFRAMDKLDEAEVHCRQALILNPGNAVALNNLGVTLRAQGKLEEAAVQYRNALALRPEYAEAHNNLGNDLQELGRLEDSVGHYLQAVRLKPDYAEAYNNLGTSLKEQGKSVEAEACYRQAFALRPNDGLRIRMATTLPVILQSTQDVSAIRKVFTDNMDSLLRSDLRIQDPVTEIGQANFYLAYHGQNDRDLQIKIAQVYERACPSLLYRAPHCQPGTRSRDDGKVRIGFISKFFKQHSIGKTTRGVLANLSRDKFSVCAIFVPSVSDDEIAEFIKQKADKVVVLPGKLGTARERIAAEELDVLFYQDIGMEPFTYFLAFSRLAPVQCSSFGHPVTSGIKNIDYFISTENWEPKGGDTHYSEQLVRLKSNIAYYYKPTVPEPLRSRSQFGLNEDDHLYVCPQTLFKFHPEFDVMLHGILRADPRGRLVLVEGKAEHWKELLLQRFGRTMPDVVERVTFVPPQTGKDFINLIAISDVMLDTIHFCGFNTSLEAFAVGTPVVTLPGEFQRGRHTLAFYKEMGFLDCIADSPSRYIEIAVRLGTDPAYRKAIKAKILASNHVLYENMETVREFERFFVRAVREAREASNKQTYRPGALLNRA